MISNRLRVRFLRFSGPDITRMSISGFVMGFRWRPHEFARVSPARPASESPRRTKPRATSVIYGDLRETASASVSNASVFRLAARRMQEFAASFIGEAAAAGNILGIIFAAGGERRQRAGFAAWERPVKRGGIVGSSSTFQFWISPCA